MDHEQFVTIVQERSGLDRTGAERAIRATLETLSERLSQDRAEDLRYWLPEPIRQWVFRVSLSISVCRSFSAASPHGSSWTCPPLKGTSVRSSTPLVSRCPLWR